MKRLRCHASATGPAEVRVLAPTDVGGEVDVQPVVAAGNHRVPAARSLGGRDVRRDWTRKEPRTRPAGRHATAQTSTVTCR